MLGFVGSVLFLETIVLALFAGASSASEGAARFLPDKAAVLLPLSVLRVARVVGGLFARVVAAPPRFASLLGGIVHATDVFSIYGIENTNVSVGLNRRYSGMEDSA